MVACGMESNGVIVVNADDPEYEAYAAMPLPLRWSMLALPHGTVGSAEAYRVLFDIVPGQPWYGTLADDNGIETDGFEAALVAAAGNFGIASANDDWQAREDVTRGRMHGAVVFGGDFLRALGYWAPAEFKHIYLDDVWETLGRELGNWRTLMDVKTPHHHPMKTGAAMDETHARVNAAEIDEHDRDCFRTWLKTAAADILRARTAMWAANGLSLAVAQSRSVLLATPCYRDVSPWYAAAMAETRVLLTSLGIRNELRIVAGHSIVHQVRNELAAKFLRSDHSDLLFIDADMGWSPWDVVRLLASTHPLIGGVGRKKSAKPDSDMSVWCFSGIPGTEDAVRTDKAGAMEIAAIGTGFVLINRAVFEALHPAYGERFFAYGINAEGEETSEDLTFCYRWRELGGEVWADPTIALRHFGAYEYGGRLMDQFRAV